MEFLAFFNNVIPVSHDFYPMDIPTLFASVIVNHTNYLFFQVTAVFNFFNQSVSRFPRPNDQDIPSILGVSSHIPQCTKPPIHIAADKNQAQQENPKQRIVTSGHRIPCLRVRQ